MNNASLGPEYAAGGGSSAAGYANPNYNPAQRHIPRKPSRNEMNEQGAQQQQQEYAQRQGSTSHSHRSIDIGNENEARRYSGAGGGLQVRNADPVNRDGSVRRRYDGSGYGDYEY